MLLFAKTLISLASFGIGISGASLPLLAADDYIPTVHLKNGTYAGIHNTYYNQDLYLGMPFAQPPLGDLRFRVPRSLNSSWTDARNATAYSPICVGYGVCFLSSLSKYFVVPAIGT